MNIEVCEQDRTVFSFHVFINVDFRFIFFTIPKIASTPWIQLFLRLEGYKDWNADPHHRDGRPFLSDLSCSEIERYLNDPNWTKAVFFRDPAERLLSAYMDKIERGSYITKRLFNAGGGEISLNQFVEVVSDENQITSDPRGLHGKTDPHWMPQYMVANLAKFLPCINFVGNFSRLQEDSRALLKKVGAWEQFGRTGWGAERKEAMFESNIAKNRTVASSQVTERYSANLLARIKTAYDNDYRFLALCGLDFT